MRKRPVRRLLARLFLTLTGWKPEGPRPAPDRFVLIAAPHTSNWDFAYMVAFAELYEIPLNWMGKHTLFEPPIGFIMRALGGIPVRRHRRENLVETLAGLFEQYDELGLAIPAEGTRSRAEYWKSGFYHIAREAKVPIVLSFLDYERKRGGFGPVFHVSGDLSRDMDRIRAFYDDKRGRFPERFATPRLIEEEQPIQGTGTDGPIAGSSP